MLRPDVAQCRLSFLFCQWFASSKHPDATLFLQGSGSTPRPQSDILALYRQIERVPWGQTQLVSHSFRQNHTARLIKRDFPYHNAIILWFVLFGKWQTE
jgi:hypothetical protein